MAQTLSQEEKQEILDRVEQKANSYQYEYRGCGQTCMAALQEVLDLPGGVEALKAAGFLGYGVAREMDMCGGLVAGMMAIGLHTGRDSLEGDLYPNNNVIDEKTGLPAALVKIREYYQQFVDKWGGSTCRAIQESSFEKVYELANPNESKVFGQIHGKDCADIVGSAARLAAEVILELPKR